eukprot:5473484-Alexandrium_andersonii.AAC.1
MCAFVVITIPLLKALRVLLSSSLLSWLCSLHCSFALAMVAHSARHAGRFVEASPEHVVPLALRAARLLHALLAPPSTDAHAMQG